MKDKKPSLSGSEGIPDSDPSMLEVWLTLVRRAGLMSLLLFSALNYGVAIGLRLDAVIYLIALLWSYLNGIYSRGRWRMSAVEALFLYLICVQAGGLLLRIAALIGYPVEINSPF